MKYIFKYFLATVCVDVPDDGVSAGAKRVWNSSTLVNTPMTYSCPFGKFQIYDLIKYVTFNYEKI